MRVNTDIAKTVAVVATSLAILTLAALSVNGADRREPGSRYVSGSPADL